MGRTIVVPQYDENYQHKQRFSGDDADLDIGIPQVYYLHNCIPTGEGFKSIAYNRVVKPVPATSTFIRILVVKDPYENKAFIGITSDNRVYMLTVVTRVWVNITAATGGWTGGSISIAYANGYTYLCLSLFNIFVVDIVGVTITAAVLAGITNNLIVGVTAASNYLVLHDAVTVYWSSATDTTDFVPSLITGAGSGIPQDIGGQIICCVALNNGFGIYTTNNTVIASYSAGIISSEQVSSNEDASTNYAWTSAGILKVTPMGCTAINPEVSDFLFGRVFEDYDNTTGLLTTSYLSDPLMVKIAFIASRYIVLSYGIATLTHALVYDTSFKRWGKLKISHVDCFEMPLSSDVATSWSSLSPHSWSYYVGDAWSEFRVLSNTAATPGRTLGFLQSDGTVKLAIWDYGNYGAEAILILGKYQITRNQLCCIQGIEVENVASYNTNFDVVVMTTIDGKTVLTPTVSPVIANTGSLVRKYSCRVTGANHSVALRGAFDLSSVELILTRHGRR